MVENEAYLHAALIIIRHNRRGRYFVLQPSSFVVFPTDAVGAYAIRLFLLGFSAAEVEAHVERRCPGAGKRWRHLQDDLYGIGAIGPGRPIRTRRWWVRRLLSLILGPVLSIPNALVLRMPIWMLQVLHQALPATPLGKPAFAHLIPFIDANLRAAGYADRTSGWRLEVARAVIAATIRSHFLDYLMYVLPMAKLNAFCRRVTEVRGMEHLSDVLGDGKGAIVVGVHWEMAMAGPLWLRQMRPVTLLADVASADYSLASQQEVPAIRGLQMVNSTQRLAARTLLDHLRAGRLVMLAFDVALPETSQNAGTNTISFLGQRVARFDTAAWLSTHTGKPIIFLSTHREGRQVVVELSPLLTQVPNSSSKREIAHLTALLYQMAEDHVRRNPESWLTWTTLHTLTVPFQASAVEEPETVQSESFHAMP